LPFKAISAGQAEFEEWVTGRLDKQLKGIAAMVNTGKIMHLSCQVLLSRGQVGSREQ
jgi:hypothetical protein